ncbi:hypothetical protein PMAYCL1PPCAC_27735, partial [Pristionchus mayeri]
MGKRLSRPELMDERCFQSEERATSLPELPIDILENIIENMDEESLISLRGACKTIRDIVGVVVLNKSHTKVYHCFSIA